jgi:hypothetical protein
MRRACATLLLVWFSFSLIAPLLSAEDESNLPACCRRGGAHQCGMQHSTPGDSSSPAFRTQPERCPYYPGAGVSSLDALNAPAPTRFFADVVRHPSVHAQTEALCRISFTRSCQKRGPPSSRS